MRTLTYCRNCCRIGTCERLEVQGKLFVIRFQVGLLKSHFMSRWCVPSMSLEDLVNKFTSSNGDKIEGLFYLNAIIMIDKAHVSKWRLVFAREYETPTNDFIDGDSSVFAATSKSKGIYLAEEKNVDTTKDSRVKHRVKPLLSIKRTQSFDWKMNVSFTMHCTLSWRKHDQEMPNTKRWNTFIITTFKPVQTACSSKAWLSGYEQLQKFLSKWKGTLPFKAFSLHSRNHVVLTIFIMPIDWMKMVVSEFCRLLSKATIGSV